VHAAVRPVPPMISTRTRRLLHLTGSGLGIIGIVFVITRLVAYRDQLPLLDLPAMSWIELACLTAAYGICGSILALAWRQLLGWHGVRVARAWSVRAYGTSQLAKYIPGNIFHLAGRQAMGVAAGMPAWPFAKSRSAGNWRPFQAPQYCSCRSRFRSNCPPLDFSCRSRASRPYWPSRGDCCAGSSRRTWHRRSRGTPSFSRPRA
jgi:hypothetical protein